MRVQHRGPGGESRASLGRAIIMFLFLLVVVHFAPTLGAPTQSTNTPAQTHQSDALSDPALSAPNRIEDWTVIAHRGWNPDFRCWILRLDQERGPNNATSSDFCAKDKADYDNHPDGSHYQTKGGWLDNVLDDAHNRSDNA